MSRQIIIAQYRARSEAERLDTMRLSRELRQIGGYGIGYASICGNGSTTIWLDCPADGTFAQETDVQAIAAVNAAAKRARLSF